MENQNLVSEERMQINDQIIDTMVRQLGGYRFVKMTGSKPLCKDNKANNPWVSFKLARNESKATHMKLIYNSGLDLYEMKFFKIHNFKMTDVASYDSLYGDQLEDIFTSVTKLYTRF